MAQRQGGGFRRKTRHKLQKRKRDKGKVTLTRILQEFKTGDKVRVMQEPAVQGGMPNPKFKNSIGAVIGRQGKSYIVELLDFNKVKRVISAGVHLKRV